jgi:predicted RNA binding protein YcfA (HicA-like mRNA interferase family)
LVRLPRISGEQAIRALERLGFVRARQRGSHVILRKDLEGQTFGCSIPLHNELAIGTLHGILKQAQVSVEDFLEQL